MTDPYVEQYSDESRAALTTATDALIDALQAHRTHLLGLRGGTAELDELFDRQAAIAGVVRDWNEAVSDHTGTDAIALIDDDDDEDDEEDFEDTEPPEAELISVVSRFDLRVTDRDAALAAGREAHLQLWTDENEQDAEAAVPRVVDALCSIGHQAGEALFAVPGVEPAGGIRHFLDVDEHTPIEPADAEFPVPTGTITRSESWSFF